MGSFRFFISDFTLINRYENSVVVVVGIVTVLDVNTKTSAVLRPNYDFSYEMMFYEA